LDIKDPLPFQTKSSEIFIGLVGAVGTDMRLVFELLSESLGSVRYEAKHIKLSKLLNNYSKIDESTAYERYNSLMDAGSELRKTIKRGDAVAIAGLIELWDQRIENHVESENRLLETCKKHPAFALPDTKKATIKNSTETSDTETSKLEISTPKENAPPLPLYRTAYIFDQLKHPKEIETLRWIYGNSFYLIAAYSSREERLERLTNLISSSLSAQHLIRNGETAESRRDICRELARKLIVKDFREQDKLGQNIEEAFPLADVFINTANQEEAAGSIRRFIQLIFGNSFHTPTKDEQGMFFAQSAALRSGDLARQIGAVITNKDGDVIATGCNDAAKAGGGQYWPEDILDSRDMHRGFDTNDLQKRNLLSDLLMRLLEQNWLHSDKDTTAIEELINETFSSNIKTLKGTQLLNLIEYFRSVHAEMSALMDAAKRGNSVQDGHMYCTTFPCHECARHIVAAGVKKVTYVEPYAKSLASELYPDSIAVDEPDKTGTHVCFQPFVGIAPRQYSTLFSLGIINRKNKEGRVIPWEAAKAEPRNQEISSTYLYNESKFIQRFTESFKELAQKFAQQGESNEPTTKN
jgi:cytidine deaminase